MTDLWPEDVGQVDESLKTPHQILKEQADLLGKKTSNVLLGRVKTRSLGVILDDAEKDFSADFSYSFSIVAPTLNNYQFRLFSISYDHKFYPVRISMDPDILSEIGDFHNTELTANNENEFLDILKKIFRANKTNRIIKALLAEINV